MQVSQTQVSPLAERRSAPQPNIVSTAMFFTRTSKSWNTT
jgi:hypothetical protein